MTQLVSRCNICGRTECPEQDVWVHRFIGTPGYGSKYDGDKLYMYFCSECLDLIARDDNLYDREDN